MLTPAAYGPGRTQTFQTPLGHQATWTVMDNGNHRLETERLVLVSTHLFLDPTMRVVRGYAKDAGGQPQRRRLNPGKIPATDLVLLLDLGQGYTDQP